MTEREYTIILDPDEEEGGYTVTVPALPGCVTQGDTLEEAIAMARDAIQATSKRWPRTGSRFPKSAPTHSWPPSA
jgi:predicted RNase H-like HicB family nuclease